MGISVFFVSIQVEEKYLNSEQPSVIPLHLCDASPPPLSANTFKLALWLMITMLSGRKEVVLQTADKRLRDELTVVDGWGEGMGH